MPLIEVHLIVNVFNPEQKRQIIQKLTDAMVSIEGENMRGVTLGQNFRSHERRMGHRRPPADHRSRQGPCRRPQRGMTCIGPASPAGVTPRATLAHALRTALRWRRNPAPVR
jgi:hypothetical protein